MKEIQAPPVSGGACIVFLSATKAGMKTKVRKAEKLPVPLGYGAAERTRQKGDIKV